MLNGKGGPGNTGVDWVLEVGSYMVSVAGTNFDIIGFDPRGMGRSTPLANCSQSAAANHKIRPRAYGIYGPEEPDIYWEETIAGAKTFGAQCAEAFGGADGAGQYMSTPVVATDMISIVDAFAKTPNGAKAAGNSSLLNYWGFSWGTFLGQTFATLYPDRVGRLLLDGKQSAVRLRSRTNMFQASWILRIMFLDNFSRTLSTSMLWYVLLSP